MFTISKVGYKEKPTERTIPHLKFQMKDVGLDELEHYIKNGYALSAVFDAEYPLRMKDKTYRNFAYSSYVMIDMDGDVKSDLQTLVDSLALTPTIAYTTFSHKKEGKGNRYRLLYIADTPIDSIEKYKSIYQYINQVCNLNLKDNCGSIPVQLCFGSTRDCGYILTNNILNINHILESKEFKDIVNSKGGQQEYIKKRDTLLSYCPSSEEVTSTDKEYLDDFRKLSFRELFEKYDSFYPLIDCNMILECESDEIPIIVVPYDYLQIIRPLTRDKDGKLIIRKWKDGEKRRLKLFYNGILRRFITKDITFEHLLHCLLTELVRHYDNGSEEDKITRQELIGIATSVMLANLESDKYKEVREYYRERNPKFKANKAYCRSHDVSAQSVVAQYRIKQLDEKRMALFKPSLSDEENLEIFMAHGLGSCIKTVRRFRKRHGIGNFKERNKENKE